MTKRLTPDDLLDTLEYAALELGRPFISAAERQKAATKVDTIARRLRAQIKDPAPYAAADYHFEEVEAELGVASRDPDFDEFADEEAA